MVHISAVAFAAPVLELCKKSSVQRDGGDFDDDDEPVELSSPSGLERMTIDWNKVRTKKTMTFPLFLLALNFAVAVVVVFVVVLVLVLVLVVVIVVVIIIIIVVVVVVIVVVVIVVDQFVSLWFMSLSDLKCVLKPIMVVHTSY